LHLIGCSLTELDQQNMKKALSYCFNHHFGGFGGGYMQLPHLAPTYAAFLAILELGPEAYDLLDR
jgi:protein farnesyltransferase subunit beta